MKKVSADEIEVIDAKGKVLKSSTHTAQNESASSAFDFQKIKIIRGGPWLILALPIFIPFLLIGFFLLIVVALLFGRSAFSILNHRSRK